MKKALIKLIRLPLTVLELLFIAGRIGYHFFKMKTAKDRTKKNCKHDFYKSATYKQHENYKVVSGNFWYSCRNCDFSKSVDFTQKDINKFENDRIRSLGRT